jgi:hypothetical protein
LVRLKGIGQISGVPLCREVFYRHFNNRRELASYFGLPPSPYNSGSMRVDQGISKAGNPHARRLAIEIAWLWIRHQPNSALSKWFAQRVGEAKGRIRRIAIVALARKLMVALWRYLETGLIPEGAVMNAASKGIAQKRAPRSACAPGRCVTVHPLGSLPLFQIGPTVRPRCPLNAGLWSRSPTTEPAFRPWRAISRSQAQGRDKCDDAGETIEKIDHRRRRLAPQQQECRSRHDAECNAQVQ